jgi:hypothetical protein
MGQTAERQLARTQSFALLGSALQEDTFCLEKDLSGLIKTAAGRPLVGGFSRTSWHVHAQHMCSRQHLNRLHFLFSQPLLPQLTDTASMAAPALPGPLALKEVLAPPAPLVLRAPLALLVQAVSEKLQLSLAQAASMKFCIIRRIVFVLSIRSRMGSPGQNTIIVGLQQLQGH